MPLKLIKAGPLKKAYNEIPQRLPIKFAFADVEGDTVKELHVPIKCRDFLLDTLIWQSGQFLDQPSKYNYGFHGPVHKADFLVYSVVAPENLALLHKVEDIFGFKKSTLTQVEGDTYLIQGDSKWLKATALLSYWTLAIRTILGETTPNWSEEIQAMYGPAKLENPVAMAESLKPLLNTKLPYPIKEDLKNDLDFHGFAGVVNFLRSPNYFEVNNAN